MAKVVVTGAAGFIGSWLVDSLIKERHTVYGLDDLSGGYTRNINPRSKFFKIDLRDKTATKKLIEKISPEILYHLAADATEGRSQFTPINCTERGIMAYLNVLIPSINKGVKRVVLTSSMSVYGSQVTPFDESMETKPDDVYGVNKASMEEITKILADVYGFEYVILRPHNVYGERQNLADPYRNVIGIWINALLRDKPIYIYGDGEQQRAFSYIHDAILCISKSGFEKKCYNEIINIGGKEPITLNEMAKIVMKEFDKIVKVVYLAPRPKEVKYAYSTYKKSEKLLDYKEKFPLVEGVKRMIVWAKELGPQNPSYLKTLELETEQVPKTWKEKLI
ncbi:MAG: NAD-dependent epimerase/dehydratase family protein [bacterium]